MRNLIKNALHKRGRSLAVLMSCILLFSSVSNGAEAATKKLKVTSPKTVTVNRTIKIKTNMKCKFKSSNKKIATVSSKGVVKGKKAGKVKITVTAKKNKQKKTVTITVKKAKEKAVTKSTATPKVDATQPPQANVPQIPVPMQSAGAKQTPSVPVTPPATRKPSETPKPATPVPTITAKPPIGTKTPKPSLMPAPTDTATSSPTTPSTTRQPVGITAEFEGKLPLNNTTSNQDVSMGFVNRMSVVVSLKYNNNTQRNLNFDEFLLDEGKIVEESGKRYVEKVVTYKEFSTILRVEIVEVDSDILYPHSIMCDYVGDIVQEEKVLDLDNIVVKAIYDADQVKEVSADQLRIDFIGDLYETEGVKKYTFRLSYNYYFEFNGETLHTCSMDSIYVPYE